MAANNSNQNKPKTISIEEADFKSSTCQLTSPRSIEACFRLGIEINELYYLDFAQFKSLNLDLHSLPQDLQQFRYDNYEKYRTDSITAIKEERNKIIKEQQEQQNKSKCKSKDNTNNEVMLTTVDHRMDHLIEEEKKMIEKIKNRQKLEIQSMIETQVKTEMMRQNNEEKEAMLREKEEKKKEEGTKKMRQQEEIRQQKETMRRNEMNRALQEQRQKIYDKFERERIRLNELNEQEKRRRDEMILKARNDELKISNHRSQLSIFLQTQENEANKKRRLQEEKEREQAEIIERRRLEKIKKSEIKKEKAERRLRESRSQAEKNLCQIRESIEGKHKNNDKKLEDFYKHRELMIKEQRDRNERKQMEILQIMKKAEEEEENKRRRYYEKQEKAEQAIFLNEITKNERTKKKYQHIESNVVKTQEHKKEIEQEAERKKNEMTLRMEEIESRVSEQRKKEERDKLQKQEEYKVKNFQKQRDIERLKRQKAYQNKLKMDELEEKERKLEEYKKERERLTLTKTTMAEGVQKEKEKVVLKFDKVLKERKKVDAEIVKELFPEDNKLYTRVKKLEEKGGKHRRSNTMTGGQMDTLNSTSGKDKHNREKNIERKVELFRERLRDDLHKVLNEEKIKESHRNKAFESATNQKEKDQIAKINAIERADSNNKVMVMQLEIQKKTKLYEDKLRRESMI